MGGPAHFGPAHSGFGLCRAELKNPDKKWARKIRPESGPVRALGLSGRPEFLKKMIF
jgi:hypothetical protein